MSNNNFLIGRGEVLTYDIKGRSRPPQKSEVYSLSEAQMRLAPQIKKTSDTLDNFPDIACPNDLAVAKVTLNPGFIARSYFPSSFLRSNGLESVGSKTVTLKPEKWKKTQDVEECTSTQLFVAGKRSAFRALTHWATNLQTDSDEAIDFARIELIEPYLPKERIINSFSENNHYEVGVHINLEEGSEFVQHSFIKFAKKIGVDVLTKLTFNAGGLWFVPVIAEAETIQDLAQFAFVRVIRPIPKLRGMRPLKRSAGIALPCSLPTAEPLSAEPSVAILDGGLPEQHPLSKWVKSYRIMDDNAADDLDGTDHGLAVTSAFLFGSIDPKKTAERPYSFVNNIRVLDKDSEEEDPLELYRTLGFVEEVLLSRQYQFINLSLGPDLPIEDTEIHGWTAVIDELLSDGETLMTVAIGNNGLRDSQSGNNRIQVPADSVNAIAVGAANSVHSQNWARASYSAIGPGRSPGIVKPDLVAFGGDTNEYFHVIDQGKNPTIKPTAGTSFAAPNVLRMAVGIRAVLGSQLTPLAIKALLVHAANQNNIASKEVGWGKIPEDLASIITSPDGVARIVYQGELKPGKYLRAPLPLPSNGINGNVVISATFCYASPTDPQDSASYTKAGLEVTFRPHEDKSKAETQANADTKGFFELKKYATEKERRYDMGKWETVLHNTKKMRGTSLKNPVFDIHYNARQGGASSSKAEKIKYALIITVEAAKHADLYNEILRNYQQILISLQPQVPLPINV